MEVKQTLERFAPIYRIVILSIIGIMAVLIRVFSVKPN